MGQVVKFFTENEKIGENGTGAKKIDRKYKNW